MAPPEHVIVLALENRSFDHMLGYLVHPDPAFDGLLGPGPFKNPGWANGPSVSASPGAKSVLPVDPDHSHEAVLEQLGVQTPGQTPSNQGFVTSYERKGRGLTEPQVEGLLAPLLNWWHNRGAKKPPICDRGPLIMLGQDPARVPVLSTLALSFGVCTRWFCSVPGETWPNRNFLHSATSDGETAIDPRFYQNDTIFELLERAQKSWHIYYDDTPQVWAFVNLWQDDARHANWYEFPEFLRHVADDTLPTYSFIEPNHRPSVHTRDHGPVIGTPGVSNSQHPGNNPVANDAYDAYPVTDATDGTDFSRGEQLIATIYEALRKNQAVFDKTVLLITYDEHGGLYDHVPPPTNAIPPGANRSQLTSFMHFLYRRKETSFDFTMLGPRVPAVVISPFIPPAAVSAAVRDHASVPATLRALFAPDQPPLTPRDAHAVGFQDLLSLAAPRHDDLPDLSAHVPAPAPVAAAGAPGTVAPTPVAAVPADGVFPDYYDDLVHLADMVGHRLSTTKGVSPGLISHTAPPPVKVAQVRQAFTEAARAIRNPGTP